MLRNGFTGQLQLMMNPGALIPDIYNKICETQGNLMSDDIDKDTQ